MPKMQVTVEKNKNGKVVIKAKADKDDVLHAKQHALEHLRPYVTAPGFRKGKAPIGIVENLVKPEKLLEDILSHLAEHAYSEALQEHKIAPITRPSVTVPAIADAKTQDEVTERLWPKILEEGIELEITTFVMPEIKLGKWKDIVKKAEIKEDKGEKKSKKTSSKDKGKKKEKDAKEVEKSPEQLKRELEDAIIGDLVESVKFDVADELIDGEADQMIYRQVETVHKLGINYEDYLKMQQKSWEDVRKETREEAEKIVRARFIISEIAKELEGELGDDPKIQDVIDYMLNLNGKVAEKSDKARKDSKKAEKSSGKGKKKAK